MKNVLETLPVNVGSQTETTTDSEKIFDLKSLENKDNHKPQNDQKDFDSKNDNKRCSSKSVKTQTSVRKSFK